MISKGAGALVAVALAASALFPAPWRSASPGRSWSFPQDHWAHPEFRTEWWYFTGNLTDAEDAARRFGYQFTVFRVGLLAEPPKLDSRWSAAQLFMGHAAVGDFAAGRHRFSDLLYREIPLLSGFGAYPDPLLAWSLAPAGTPGRWELRWNGEGFDFSMRDDGREMGLELSTRPVKPLVLQGPEGFSRKGEGEGAASLYYSFTRLQTTGTLTLQGKTTRVRGTSWMDKEFSTSPLAPNQEGWDWFALRLADGRDVMLYVLRRKGGGADFRRGTLIDPSGAARYLDPDEWSLRSVQRWKSPRTGAEYPSRWVLEIPGESVRLEIAPVMADQENVASRSANLFYWEGSVRVFSKGAEAGEGYVELTGYGENNRPPL